jgi:hypothetical protein
MNSLIQLKTITLPRLTALALACFAPVAGAQSHSDLGSCSVTVDGNRLLVVGDENPNTIDVVGTYTGVQVTCDGATDTFAGIEEITLEGRDDDDRVTVDDSLGFLGGSLINIFGEGGDDLLFQFSRLYNDEDPYSGPLETGWDGGTGYYDTFTIVGGPLADRFDIAPGTEANSVEVQVIDKATGVHLADISGSRSRLQRSWAATATMSSTSPMCWARACRGST